MTAMVSFKLREEISASSSPKQVLVAPMAWSCAMSLVRPIGMYTSSIYLYPSFLCRTRVRSVQDVD